MRDAGDLEPAKAGQQADLEGPLLYLHHLADHRVQGLGPVGLEQRVGIGGFRFVAVQVDKAAGSR